MAKKPLTLSLDLSRTQRLAWWKDLAFNSSIGVGVVRHGPDGPLLGANRRPIKDNLAMLFDAESGRKFNLNPGGRSPDIPDEDVYEAVTRACETSRTKTQALKKADEELKATRPDGFGLAKKHCGNPDEMRRRRYARACKNLNRPPYPHLAD